MLFSRDHRDTATSEVGAGGTAAVAKALGERWGQQTDRGLWEAEAAADRQRFDSELAAYNRGLEAEALEERRARDAAACGPSGREVMRAEKRERMEEEVARRAEKPKAAKKVKP